METIVSLKPVIALVVPGVTAILVMAFGKYPNYREACSIVGGIIAFVAVLLMSRIILDGSCYEYEIFRILPGISLKLRADSLGIIFGIICTLLWLVVSFYNIGYMRGLDEHAQTRYYTSFALTIFGAVGVAFAANVFTLYMFYEIITIVTYPLVAHHQDKEAYQGARKYLVYLVGTSKLFFLPAMVLTYILAGTLDFAPGDFAHGIFPPEADPVLVTITYVLYIAGIAKAAIMPFHNWLPSAMVAPTPVSALLHAVAVVKAGVFSISRIMLSVFGVETLTSLHLGIPTAYLASFTILLASVIALTKDDLKARLAYSTVSQLSYIIIGIAMLTPSSIAGGLIHIANHAFSKITLFLCAGTIFVLSGIRSIKQMSGLGRKLPVTFAAFFIASLSMVGIPGVCGFITKWYLVVGSIEASRLGLLVVLLASTLLNAAYFMPIVYKAFFEDEPEGQHTLTMNESSAYGLFMVIPLLSTALISVVIGIYPGFFMNIVKTVVMHAF